ncbi:MAG: hypothetical protein F4Y41_08655 [Gammaproteobacteria bacterium]|nr:hypothetical protein [Gammaproteobacteria bacterium]
MDSEQLPDLAAHVDSLVDEWHDEAFRCKADKRALHYRAPPRERNAERLLYGHGDTHRPGLWMTLQSMRNVESEGVLRMHG